MSERIDRVAKAILGSGWDESSELMKSVTRGEAMRAIAAMPDPDAPACEQMLPDEDGWSDWLHPLPGYLLQCCDCGLVHDMEFAIGETINKGGPFNDGEGEDGVVLFRARRHDPALTDVPQAPPQPTEGEL